MFSRFFIEHPVFANVIAVLTVIFGLVTVFKLPIEQYPDITPPTVQVTTTYPGAERSSGGQHGRLADRGAGQRRRAHALHVVNVGQ